MSESSLIEWTELFIKNKNLLHKTLSSLSVVKNALVCEYNYGKHTYYIFPELKQEILSSLNTKYTTIVCLNKKSNLSFITKNWNSFVKYPHLSIIFTNPSANEKWIICPHTHARIADHGSLALGLKTMFESIEEVNE